MSELEILLYPVGLVFGVLIFALYSLVCAVWVQLVLSMIFGPNRSWFSFTIREDDMSPYFYKDLRFYPPLFVGLILAGISVRMSFYDHPLSGFWLPAISLVALVVSTKFDPRWKKTGPG